MTGKTFQIGKRALAPSPPGQVPEVLVDLDVLVDSRLLVQANSGAGKSWVLRRLLEQTHGLVQHIVIDVEGEFHTLRERFDYVLARPRGGDCVAEPRTAKLLARRLLELGVSAIVDIYELKAYERAAFVRRFLDQLVNAPKRLWHPVLVVIDEAHVFCPQSGKAESASAVIDLMTRGRKRGFCGVLATQRLSRLHKDAAAEANNRLIGRTGLDVDVKRASDELGFSGRDQQQALRHLTAGAFFAYGPAIANVVTEILIGGVRTTHHRAGQAEVPTPPPRATIRQILGKLDDLPREAAEEERTITGLTDELRRVKAELGRAERAAKEAAPEPDSAAIEAAYERGRADAQEGAARRLGDIKEALGTRQRLLGEAAEASRVAAEKLTEFASDHQSRMLALFDDVPASAALQGRPRRDVSVPPRPPLVSVKPPERGGLRPAHRKILDALAWWENVDVREPDRVQVAFIASRSSKGGSWANDLGALRTGGFVHYPTPGRVALTPAGRERARLPDRPGTTEMLQDIILERLRPALRTLVRVLIEAHPEEITRDELAARAGRSPLGGSFANDVGRLRSMGVATYPRGGHVQASDLLFLDGPI